MAALAAAAAGPPAFGAGGAAVRMAGPGPARDVAVALEIKGTAGTQRIPLEPHAGWVVVERPVDWPAIGTVTEVVVSVSRIGEGPPAVGSVALDVRFARLA